MENYPAVCDSLIRTCRHHSTQDALHCLDKTLTYSALAARIEGIRQQLGERFIRGQRVAIYLPKGIDYVAAIYGILVSGNTYVPIDASQPIGRVRQILSEAEPALVMTAHAYATGLSDAAPLLILGDQPFSASPEIDNWVAPSGKDIAAVLFTSGSTGVPKGVQISHGMLSNFIGWAVDELSLSHTDVFSNHASYAFDLSTFDLFAASQVGGAVWLITKEEQQNVEALLTGIQQHAVTVWYSVPSVLSMLVMSGGLTSLNSQSLRHVIFAGEAYPIGALRMLHECLPADTQLSNWYGPTETNVCLAHKVTEADLLGTSIPIGTPISGSKAIVVDEDGREVTAEGEWGELVISGTCVTPGYSNCRDTRNALNHTQNCHSTGDLVHFDQGRYFFHGRIDDMVKVNGNRVELGEIEACLLLMPGVVKVAVVAKLGDLQQTLVANLVLNESALRVTLLDIKTFVSERLPRYMVPHKVRFLTSLPVNHNGKVNRKRLQQEE